MSALPYDGCTSFINENIIHVSAAAKPTSEAPFDLFKDV